MDQHPIQLLNQKLEYSVWMNRHNLSWDKIYGHAG